MKKLRLFGAADAVEFPISHEILILVIVQMKPGVIPKIKYVFMAVHTLLVIDTVALYNFDRTKSNT